MTGARHSQRSVLLMRRYRGTARPYGSNARAGTSGGALGLQAIGMCQRWWEPGFRKTGV